MKKIDLIFLGILVFVSALAWQGVLNQSIDGEGFYYFSPGPRTSLILPDGRLTNLRNGYDNFPKIATYLLEKSFGPSIEKYMLFAFMTILLVNISVYLFIRYATGQPWIALLASIYSGLNYTGNFQFYGRGHFQWFLQRVPEVLPIMASFIFLVDYTKTKKIKSYFLSLFFQTLSIFMTHYTIMFLPFYPAFLLATSLLGKNSFKEKVRLFSLSVPFILINYAIVGASSLSPEVIRGNESFIHFVSRWREVISQISFQLVVVTIPFNVLRFLTNLTKIDYLKLIPSLEIPVYLFHLLIIWVLYKRRFASVNLVIASFLSLIGALFLTVYTGRINVFNQIEQGRYYYIPAIYVGIIFACLIYSLVFKKASKKKSVVLVKVALLILIITFWTYINTKAIWKKIRASQHFYTAQKVMLNHLNKVKEDYPQDAVVFVPSPPGPNSIDFLKKYYGKKDTQFLYLDENWKAKLPQNFDPKKVFVFKFEKGAVLDSSQEYRKQLKKTPAGNRF